MKIIIQFTLLLSFLLLGMSCEENVALEYENDPALYFANYTGTVSQRDSLTHSFFFISGIRDTIYVEINTMGMISDTPRPFVLEQSNVGKQDAAVPGVHYVPFDDSEVAKYFIIPANSVSIRFPVILLRDKSLNTSEVRLELKIVQNENFRPGMPEWSNFLIKTTAQAVKPLIWDNYWRYSFGASWSSVKMRFIIDVTGHSEWDSYLDDSSYMNYLRDKVLAAFMKYNMENPNDPMIDEFENEVSFTS